MYHSLVAGFRWTNPFVSTGTRGWSLPLGSWDTRTGVLRTIRHPRMSRSSLLSESNTSDLQWLMFLGNTESGPEPSPWTSSNRVHSESPFCVRK